jgi:hypothetical protein
MPQAMRCVWRRKYARSCQACTRVYITVSAHPTTLLWHLSTCNHMYASVVPGAEANLPTEGGPDDSVGVLLPWQCWLCSAGQHDQGMSTGGVRTADMHVPYAQVMHLPSTVHDSQCTSVPALTAPHSCLDSIAVTSRHCAPS